MMHAVSDFRNGGKGLSLMYFDEYVCRSKRNLCVEQKVILTGPVDSSVKVTLTGEVAMQEGLSNAIYTSNRFCNFPAQKLKYTANAYKIGHHYLQALELKYLISCIGDCTQM